MSKLSEVNPPIAYAIVGRLSIVFSPELGFSNNSRAYAAVSSHGKSTYGTCDFTRPLSLGLLGSRNIHPIRKGCQGRHSATLELKRIADVTHWVAGALLNRLFS